MSSFRCLILLLACALYSLGQTAASCGDQTVTYGPAPKALEQNIQILALSQFSAAPEPGKRVASPHGTSWFIEADPDYTNTRLPWATTLSIGDAGHAGVFLQASFKDHGNSFSAQWLNEKLIFIQVSWGRMASSDLILDISRHQFLYNEFAHYGELFEPCK